MAKVRAPLLSIEAHGKLNETMIYQTIKGQPIAKAYAIPTYPGTPAQEAWRENFSMRSTFWRQELKNEQMSEAWNRYNQTQAGRDSGYTQAMKHMRAMLALGVQHIFCVKVALHAGIPQECWAYMLKIEDLSIPGASNPISFYLTQDMENWGTPEACVITGNGSIRRTFPTAGLGTWYVKAVYQSYPTIEMAGYASFQR